MSFRNLFAEEFLLWYLNSVFPEGYNLGLFKARVENLLIRQMRYSVA